MWDLVKKEEKQYFRNWYFGIVSLSKSSKKRVYTTLILLHSNPCYVNKTNPEASVSALQFFPLHSKHLLESRMPEGRTGILFCPHEF